MDNDGNESENGPAKWVRFLISPPPGRVLVYRDFMQQEVRIAAVLSGDKALLEACESGDVYIGIATQLGFYHEGMSQEQHDSIRTMFKTVVLGIQYGMAHHSLAIRTGCMSFEAAEILARLKARFRRYEDYATSVVDRAGLDMEIATPFGWIMQCPPKIKSRVVRNFPIQSTGAEILHVACILAEQRGIEMVAPIHDALMCEANAADAEDVKHALDRLMRDASSIVLRGYELPSDFQIVHAGGSFFDKAGKDLWAVITEKLAGLDAGKVVANERL
jgi:DNA polymerase I-like protein with 3'-5' exonuclease and polymerase domains